MKHKSSLALIVALVTLPKIILAISEHDFAYIAEIETHNSTPYYELEIPSAVYETVSRSDLGDLRILNGDGQVVPHGLRMMAMKKNTNTEMMNIPFFPLYQNQISQEAGKSITDLHLNIKRDSQGEVINIQSSLPKDTKSQQLSGYLLDLRQWKKPIDQLKITWKQTDGSSFIRKLNISKSSNLERWRSIATGKTLVNLTYQNHQLTDNTISLSSSSSNYLRLIFSDQKPGLELDSIQVSHTKSYSQRQRNWQAVTLGKTENAGEYHFQHNIKSLARQLEIKLPENNTVVRVQVLSRSTKEQPWRYSGSTLLYRLSVNGTDIEKSKINITASRDNNWLLRFDQQGGGIGTGLPEVKLAWQPQQLVFIARGQAPYRMVWGSAKINPVVINANQLLPVTTKSMADNNIGNASMLSQAELLSDTIRSINKKALEPKSKEINWRHWILWIALIAAALMLIWMAVGLMKKMSE